MRPLCTRRACVHAFRYWFNNTGRPGARRRGDDAHVRWAHGPKECRRETCRHAVPPSPPPPPHVMRPIMMMNALALASWNHCWWCCNVAFEPLAGNVRRTRSHSYSHALARVFPHRQHHKSHHTLRHTHITHARTHGREEARHTPHSTVMCRSTTRFRGNEKEHTHTHKREWSRALSDGIAPVFRQTHTRTHSN